MLQYGSQTANWYHLKSVILPTVRYLCVHPDFNTNAPFDLIAGTGKKEKGKKNKGKTLNLNEFLAGTPVVRTVQVKKSWADEVEEEQCKSNIKSFISICRN